ncbi:MAG: competence/damage-inducible protein A [Oscillospiraceae bacterium]|nr:competence/damage-inducible protein A [Oscillospiraceae bacterium]
MTAQIISVGTELLLGDILNTNAQYLSQELAALGISVLQQHTVGDNHDRLAELVNEAKKRSDLLIFTGGLGPTEDDLTKETVAACFHDTLQFDEESYRQIEAHFARTGRPLTANNRKQAMVPVRGHKIPNDQGTAPGAWFEDEGRCAVLMPGVPWEMKAMWQNGVLPLLAQKTGCLIHSLVLRVKGGESWIDSQVGHLFENENPTAAIYCKAGECEIRITARRQNEAEAEESCREYAQKFYDILGDAIYDENVPGMEHTVVRLLAQKGMKAATAESCTGGLIAQRLTGVPGASEVFHFGFVTYANEAKEKMLGVSAHTLDTQTAVSPETAAQMAAGARAASGADVAVSVTGIAGPGGGTEEKPVGLVYLGGACQKGVWVRRLMLGQRARDTIRLWASQRALDMLRCMILDADPDDSRFYTYEEIERSRSAPFEG